MLTKNQISIVLGFRVLVHRNYMNVFCVIDCVVFAITVRLNASCEGNVSKVKVLVTED